MGCFLKCFSGSKDANRRKKRNKVNPKIQKHRVEDPPQSTVSIVQETVEAEKSSINLVPELRSETEEQLSPSPRKRVTFNSNVTTYEAVLVHESTDSLVEGTKVIEKEKVKDLAKSKKDTSVSDEDSCVSSVGSYPTNHRYQNYGGSDDEAEEYGDSDLDEDEDEDDDEDDDVYGYSDDDVDVGIVGKVWSESISTETMESRVEKSLKRVDSEEVNSPFKVCISPNVAPKVIGTNGYVRDRSVYVHPVLNPVENLSQWKAVKSNGTSHLKPQKENLTVNGEAFIGTVSKQSLTSLKPNPEAAVCASLSNWLVSPEKGTSQGSNSGISFEDRPILGALTVEELKQSSANSTPRKSPCRSPDDMPIIGSVGAYWK